MECIGGIILQDILRQFREDLESYFGYIVELRTGLKPKDVIEKPVALEWYDLVQSTGIHIYSGGLVDQPYIWLCQWEIIEGVKKMYEALEIHMKEFNAPSDATSQFNSGLKIP